MKEIGGYLELEHSFGPMLHEGAIKLNSGRNALRYILRGRNIKKIKLPYYLCNSVSSVCIEEKVSIDFYRIDLSFLPPEDLELRDGEWLYIVNYYGQLAENLLDGFKSKYSRVIVDNAQAYFTKPTVGADAIYTCRKFFGVPDGAMLFSDCQRNENLPGDESYARMMHLLGRFERSAAEYYKAYRDNEESLLAEPMKSMSRLTENLLRSVDYDKIRIRRTDNFKLLNSELAGLNKLSLNIPDGAFAYPLLTDNGSELRRKLIDNKIYVPCLWPNVLEECAPESLEYQLAFNLLPLPCDQRYTAEDMKYITALIEEQKR